MVRIDSKKKYGFSLVEVLVSMLIMSVMFLAITKVTTRKPTKETEHTPHGYYECIQRNNIVSEYRTQTNKTGGQMERPEAGKCNIEPQNGVHFLNVNVFDNTTFRHLSTKEMLFNEKVELAHPADILNDYSNYIDHNMVYSNDTTNEELIALQSQLSGLNSELSGIQSELSSLETDLSGLNSEISELEKQRAQSENYKAQRQWWYESWMSDVNFWCYNATFYNAATCATVSNKAAKELEYIAYHQQNIDNYNAQINQKSAQINQKNTEISQKNTEKNNISTQINSLNEQIANTPAEQISDFGKEIQEFTTYLSISHPDSQTYNIIKNGVPDDLQQILFIAW